MAIISTLVATAICVSGSYATMFVYNKFFKKKTPQITTSDVDTSAWERGALIGAVNPDKLLAGIIEPDKISTAFQQEWTPPYPTPSENDNWDVSVGLTQFQALEKNTREKEKCKTLKF